MSMDELKLLIALMVVDVTQSTSSTFGFWRLGFFFIKVFGFRLKQNVITYLFLSEIHLLLKWDRQNEEEKKQGIG